MTVRIIVFCVALAAADSKDPARIENGEIKYQLDVPGREPITVIETAPNSKQHWRDFSRDSKEHDNSEIKHVMTDIIHDADGYPRCFGPSCQEGFSEDGPQRDLNDYYADSEKLKDYPDFQTSMQALAAKLKKEKYKSNPYNTDSYNSDPVELDHSETEDNAKVYTSWNRLKVKQHKHPYDDKEGWVTLEPVAWSTSKISKWKPNVKKHKPNQWIEDDNRPDSDRYNPYQGIDYNNNYPHQQKKPSMNRPTYINNKLHGLASEYDSEMPSKPTWSKPTLNQQSTYNYPSSWSPDDSRRPHKPNCDSEEQYNDSDGNDDTVFYGISDSVVTDHRPSKFPLEYEALHQAPYQKRPIRRPTQVIYAGNPELDSDRSSRPPYGDGQWVLLSTTKGYRNKKRQRSLSPTPADDRSDGGMMTSHQAVALTVLPIDNAHTNMTTSHGGLLEVEKSFKTVEESKKDMDKKYDLASSSSLQNPSINRVVKRRIVSNVAPDSSTVFAAVGAGMLPATMAMVVPMMLGRRRRREVSSNPDSNINNIFYKHQ